MGKSLIASSLPKIVLPSLFLAGLFYHVIYWGTLGINPLSNMQISDLVITSAIPFLKSQWNILFVYIIPLAVVTTNKKALPYGGAGKVYSAKKLDIIRSILVILWMGILIAILFIPNPLKWTLFVIIFQIGFSTFIIHFLDFHNFIDPRNEKMEKYIIEVLLFIILLSLASGRTQAEILLTTTKTNTAIVLIDNKSNKLDRVLLGEIGESSFFLNLNNKVIEKYHNNDLYRIDYLVD